MHKKNKNHWGFETQAIHAGQAPDSLTGAVMPPIYLSSTYVQSSPGKPGLYEYIRSSNPTRKAYEDCFCLLERGVKAFAMSSGCAAITTVLHLLEPGDHILAGKDLYGGTYRLFKEVFQKKGIECTFVDLVEANDLEQWVRKNTKLIWMESPTNPLLRLVDIQKISEQATNMNILSAVDNTFLSPFFQKPLLLGADIVVHSSTKYISGHSDILGGVIVVKREDLAEKLTFLSQALGPVSSPFDSYMSLRSLKTLSLRMKAHEENAKIIAKFLSEHPKVTKLLYPDSPYHSQASLIQKQMSGSGGMMTFSLKGGFEEVKTFLKSLKIVALAESLGGVESLIAHPSSMTHASVPPEIRQSWGIEDSMLRLSVGIETSKDLIRDIEEALNF